MKVRRTLAVIVGIVQSVIAVLTVIFACILYFKLFDIQTLLNSSVESLYFNVLVLLGFGVFSLINGLLLTYEWLESR